MLQASPRVIPPFESGAALVARMAHLMRPKDPLTVSAWAQRHLGYDPDVLPWQIEVMDALSDPETAEVGLMGPAQAGKSEIGLAWIGWSIEHSPADMLICQPDKAMAQDFVVRRVGPTISRTPVLKGQLLPLVNADNMFLKQFRGMLLTTIWPVAAQFRARPVPRGWLDDFDQIPDDIEGQGSAVQLLDARATTFEGRETKFVSSSPARESGGGIEGFCKAGTDEYLEPECPSCGERIAVDMIRDLQFDRTGSLDEAESSAHVVCPANGCILEPEDRRRLLDSLGSLPGKGFVRRNQAAGKRRRGFMVDGLLAFTSWQKLARKWREAELEWEMRQDEAPLRAFYNTNAGKNYRSKLSGEKPIATNDLMARREPGWKAGTVPAGVKVVVITVDVQHNRFECAAIGWGTNREMWVLDRWSIDTLADGLTVVQPLRYREHWAALLPLFSRGWKLADGSGRTVQALTVAVDARGGESDLAIGFWHLASAAGIHPNRVTLLQGGNNPRAPQISAARRSDQKAKGGTKRNSPSVWTINVHWLKNILDTMLRREKPGPGYIHLPSGLAEHHIDELTAEQLVKGKWEKIRPRNETWDLLVYGLAAILRRPFAQSVLHMRWVPPDFRVPDPIVTDAIAPEPVQAEAEIERQEQQAAPSARKRAAVRRQRPQGWMGRLNR